MELALKPLPALFPRNPIPASWGLYPPSDCSRTLELDQLCSRSSSVLVTNGTIRHWARPRSAQPGDLDTLSWSPYPVLHGLVQLQGGLVPLIPWPVGSMSGTAGSDASSGLTSKPHRLLEKGPGSAIWDFPECLGVGLRLSISECLQLSNLEVKAAPSAPSRDSVPWVSWTNDRGRNAQQLGAPTSQTVWAARCLCDLGQVTPALQAHFLICLQWSYHER